MIAKLETWGIVLAGHWNRMIFTPEWVGARLFHQDEIETQIALLPVFPVLYRHEQVILEASGGRLIFRPRFDSPVSLEAAERMAVTVLDDLPNTPLMGVGVNFTFEEKRPPGEMLQLFNLNDARKISRANWETPETKIVRRLTSELGTMNLSLGYENGIVCIDINFHTEATGATPAVNKAAREAVFGRISGLRETAVKFLRDIYNLRFEEGDDDE